MEGTIPLVAYANAPTSELITRSDRLCEGDCEEAMSTTGYANALIPEFSKRCDRLCESHNEISDDGGAINLTIILWLWARTISNLTLT